jgi:hypothetical protein
MAEPVLVNEPSSVGTNAMNDVDNLFFYCVWAFPPSLELWTSFFPSFVNYKITEMNWVWTLNEEEI